MRSFKDYSLVFFKGMAMGGADVIPGVSGGTIAFITGIYEELLSSISKIDFNTFKNLFQGNFKLFWTQINGNFLLSILLGILVSVFSLMRFIKFAMAEFPIPLWSFFFGLIIISAFSVAKEIKQWRIIDVVSIIVGIVVALFITSSTPTTTTDAWWFVFITGMVAICAMILPGVSGSFILLIFGKYMYILTAVSNFDIAVVSIFGAGCIVGLLGFSRVVSWLLKNFHNPTIAILSGFMIGSLYKIWPWREVVEFRVDSEGHQVPFIERNILPDAYQEITGNNPQILFALLFFALGVIIVVLIEKIAFRLAQLRKK